MRIIKLFSITFLFLCLIFGTMVSCDGDGDNGEDEELAGELVCDDGIDNDDDGDTDCDDIDCILDPACEEPVVQVISCDELVMILCDRADTCGFVLAEECLFSYMFEDLLLECEDFIQDFDMIAKDEFVSQTPSEECMMDMASFDCQAFDNFDLPPSCGDGWLIPPIAIPDNPCGEIFTAQCSRVEECDTVTFDQCLVGSLFLIEDFLGFDCDAALKGSTFDECIADLPSFDCVLVNAGEVPPTCVDQLLLVP